MPPFEAMTARELEHLKATYRTAQNFTLGHVYRDIMRCVEEIERLKAELASLKQDVDHWEEALGALTNEIDEKP